MEDKITNINEIKQKIKRLIEKRKWTESHSPKNLSMSIAIEASELMEIFQWLSTEEAWDIKNSQEFTRLKEELADVLIYCLSFANQLGIDAADAIEDKMAKNAKRFPVVNEGEK